MDSTLSASTLIPAGIVASAILLSVTLGIVYGKLITRIEALEKADDSLKNGIDGLAKAINEIKEAQPKTGERLLAIEIEQKQQRQILENIQGYIQEKRKL